MPGGFASSFQFPTGGGMPGNTRTYHFSTGGGTGGAGGFAFSDPESIFADFFRSSMGGGMGDDDMGGMPPFGNFGSRRTSGIGSGRGSSGRFRDVNGVPRAPTPEVTVVEKPLSLTLEELFKGTTKKMKIGRKKFDATSGKRTVEDRILEVPIKPGLKAGSKIKFKDVGDQVEGGTQDLHFIVGEVGSPL